MRLALYLLSAVATALAWIVARRRAEHGPIAWALSIALAADIGRAVLLAWVLPPPNLAPSTPPLEGALRIAIYADRALFAAWPAALAAVALRVLARRPAWPVAIGYVASVAVLVGWYPALRFDALRKAYLAIELAAGFVGFGALVFYRRTKPGKAYVSVRVAAVLICGHFAAMLTGPYRVGFFGEAWAVAQLAYVAIFAALILLQLGEELTHSER